MLTEMVEAEFVTIDELEEILSDGSGAGLEVEHAAPTDGANRLTFDPSKIDVATQVRTVDLLLTRLREGELDLSPDFQRKANIWSPVQKSSLIESMLLRIPIPSLYVSEDHSGNYTVVDGLQRICAIAHFVEVDALNKAVKQHMNPLRLTGLESLLDQGDKLFDELPRPLRRRIQETELTLHVIRANTPPDVKFNIFSRINKGGLPLTPQEIRNAIYEGQWQQRVRAMAESPAFLKATESKIRGERMADIELALRFVAHYSLKGRNRPADQEMDTFLNETVKTDCKSWSEEFWREVETAFYRSLEAAPRVFGRYAFRKYPGPGGPIRPINRSLFEAETVLLARHSPTEIDALDKRSDQVLNGLAVLHKDHKFSTSIAYATGRGSSSNTRLELLGNMLREVISA